MSTFDDGITIDKLEELISNGKNFASATTNLANKLKAVKGDDLVSYLLTTAGETGGGMIVESMVEDYLDQMKVNRNLLSGDIQYALYIDNSTNDLILKAAYCYNDPMFSIFTEGLANVLQTELVGQGKYLVWIADEDDVGYVVSK